MILIVVDRYLPGLSTDITVNLLRSIQGCIFTISLYNVSVNRVSYIRIHIKTRNMPTSTSNYLYESKRTTSIDEDSGKI